MLEIWRPIANIKDKSAGNVTPFPVTPFPRKKRFWRPRKRGEKRFQGLSPRFLSPRFQTKNDFGGPGKEGRRRNCWKRGDIPWKRDDVSWKRGDISWKRGDGFWKRGDATKLRHPVSEKRHPVSKKCHPISKQYHLASKITSRNNLMPRRVQKMSLETKFHSDAA